MKSHLEAVDCMEEGKKAVELEFLNCWSSALREIPSLGIIKLTGTG